MIVLFLKRNCKQIRKHFQGDRHCFSQASMLAKLLALPLHPPKTKTSHLPDSLLKKYRSKAALQGPTSAGKWQSGLSTDFLEEETPLPPQKLSHFSLEAKLFPLPSQPPYSNVWQAPFWGLKCHLWRLARQFPVSGFKSHTSRKRKKKNSKKREFYFVLEFYYLWILAFLWSGTFPRNLLHSKNYCCSHYILRKWMFCMHCLWCRSKISCEILCMALDPDPRYNCQIAFLMSFRI